MRYQRKGAKQMSDLKKIFNPNSIAIIGASNEKESVGYGLFNNIIKSDYKGKIYPVNIKRNEVQGVKAYKSILDIPSDIDLAIIATPALTVPNVYEECCKKNVKGVVIISSGFLEEGLEGKKLWEELIKIKSKYDVPIIGPNCMGFINPLINLNSSFSKVSTKKGSIAVVSQSGALGSSILDYSILNNIGLSFFISLGSMIDISFNETFDYLAEDKTTKAVIVYMESLKNSQEFLKSAFNLSMKKPVYVLKSGKNSFGQKAALSHTGSLTGDDMVFQRAFERTGLIRLNNLEEMFDCMNFLNYQKFPKNNKLLIITNAGGPGVIASDYIYELKGDLAKISKNTFDKLNKILPNSWSKNNPIDILGDADVTRYRNALEICINDNLSDGILIILTPQSMTDSEAIANEIIELEKKYSKPIFASFIGGKSIENSIELFKKSNIPVFLCPERAIKSFILITEYYKVLEKIKGSNFDLIIKNKDNNNKIIKECIKNQENILDSLKSKKFFESYGFNVGDYGFAKTKEEAVKISEKLGFPVVMKIVSKDIVHKTEVGGVKLNIKNSKEVMKCYDDIINSVKKKLKNIDINGILIEKMYNKKYELLIGAKKDSIFGNVIVFGSGGIYANYYKDISLEIFPIDLILAEEQIKRTKIYELLKGFRGDKKVNINNLKEIILKFSKILNENPNIKEIDINPYAIDGNDGIILDSKVILE
jgi:acetyltransferase